MTALMTVTPPRLQQALSRLFAWLFLYPDDDRLETLRRGAAELLDAASLWDSAPWAASLKSLLTALADLSPLQAEALRREHTRLFVVKPLAPPYESFYVAPDAEARGWVTVQIQRLYARHGLAIGELNELPDHLAVELEFLSWLFEQEAEALEQSESTQARAMQEERANFLSRHLRRWLPALTRQVQKYYPEGFYTLVLAALWEWVTEA